MFRGIVYDVGTEVSEHFHSRPEWQSTQTARDLEVIAADLSCNAVRIVGTDPARLAAAAHLAGRQGLDVWLSPLLYNQLPTTTLDHLVDCVNSTLRCWPGSTTLTVVVGSELTWNMKGILPGGTVARRILNPLARPMLRFSRRPSRRLNQFLGASAAAVRRTYDGPLTYAAAPIERVDWTPFAHVSLNYCGEWSPGAGFGSDLARHVTNARSVVLSEVGLATFIGAADFGASGWTAARSVAGRLEMGELVSRSEELQARELVAMIGEAERTGVDGTFVYTFAAPAMPHDRQYRFDLDTASYSIVKTVMGPAGHQQPQWEPKLAFDDLKRCYRELDARDVDIAS